MNSKILYTLECLQSTSEYQLDRSFLEIWNWMISLCILWVTEIQILTVYPFLHAIWSGIVICNGSKFISLSSCFLYLFKECNNIWIDCGLLINHNLWRWTCSFELLWFWRQSKGRKVKTFFCKKKKARYQ